MIFNFAKNMYDLVIYFIDSTPPCIYRLSITCLLQNKNKSEIMALIIKTEQYTDPATNIDKT